MRRIKRRSITKERAEEVLSYDPVVGKFYREGKDVSSQKINQRYYGVMIDKEVLSFHGLAFLFMEGEYVVGVDHIDGNPANNSWDNLRRADQSINNKNVRRRKDNVSNITGVSWDSQTRKWKSQIQSNGQKRHLGLHKDFFEACCVRKSAENYYEFHTNHGMVKENII